MPPGRRARIRVENIQDKPPPKPIIGELGWTGVNPYGFYAQEETYDFYNVTIQDLERMIQQDGQAQSLYRILTMPIRASEIHLTPQPGGTPEYEFIKATLLGNPQQGGMEIPWKRVIAQLARAVLSGAEILEKCYEVKKYQGQDLILLDKLAPRPRRTLRFRMDVKGNFDGVIQLVPMAGDIPIPKEKCLHYVVNSEMNPVFGQSMLLPAYYHYQNKHKLYYVGHLGFAIAAIALKKLRIPPEAEPNDKRLFEQAAAEIGVNTTITVPEGYDIEFEYGSKVPAEMIPFVDHHDNQMAKAVLAQVVNLGTSGGNGSYALSETHLDLVFVVIESLMDEISYLFNTEVIPELIDWNFGTGKYPVLEVAPSYTDRRATVAEIFRHISGARQINVTPEFLLALERSMATQLGFDNIPYDQQEGTMIKDAKKQKDAQAGLIPKKISTAPSPVVGVLPQPPKPGQGQQTVPQGGPAQPRGKATANNPAKKKVAK